LYETLGFSKSATPSTKEIKTKYYKLAQKYHPDKAGDSNSAAEKFKNISAAYEVLGDETARAAYDAAKAEQMNRGSR